MTWSYTMILAWSTSSLQSFPYGYPQQLIFEHKIMEPPALIIILVFYDLVRLLGIEASPFKASTHYC